MSSGWNNKFNANEENASHEDNGSSWSKKWGGGKATSESGEKHSKSSDWSNPNASNKDMSSGWNNKFNANEETGGTGDHDGGWNKRKAPGEHQKTPWKTNDSNLDGNPSSGFQDQDGWGTPKPPQDKSSGWNHKSIDNEKDGDGKDQGDSNAPWREDSKRKFEALPHCVFCGLCGKRKTEEHLKIQNNWFTF